MRDKDFPYENLAYYGYDTIKKKRKEGLFISFSEQYTTKEDQKCSSFFVGKKWIRIHFFKSEQGSDSFREPAGYTIRTGFRLQNITFPRMNHFPIGMCRMHFFAGTGEKGKSIGTRFRLRNIFWQNSVFAGSFSHQKSYYWKRCILKQKKGGRKRWKTKRLHM